MAKKKMQLFFNFYQFTRAKNEKVVVGIELLQRQALGLEVEAVFSSSSSGSGSMLVVCSSMK